MADGFCGGQPGRKRAKKGCKSENEGLKRQSRRKTAVFSSYFGKMVDKVLNERNNRWGGAIGKLRAALDDLVIC